MGTFYDVVTEPNRLISRKFFDVGGYIYERGRSFCVFVVLAQHAEATNWSVQLCHMDDRRAEPYWEVYIDQYEVPPLLEALRQMQGPLRRGEQLLYTVRDGLRFSVVVINDGPEVSLRFDWDRGPDVEIDLFILQDLCDLIEKAYRQLGPLKAKAAAVAVPNRVSGGVGHVRKERIADMEISA